jgi:hypothetical protein
MNGTSKCIAMFTSVEVAAVSVANVLLSACRPSSVFRRKRSCPFVVKNRKPNKRRKRQGIVQELLDLDDPIFLRMMRMPKDMFLELARRITPHVRLEWTEHSMNMANVGSGSEVEPAAILGATIRWLAGGSPWDVAFMFQIHCSTFHIYKWRVIDALNIVLQDNIAFPTSDQGLSCVAQGFRYIPAPPPPAPML